MQDFDITKENARNLFGDNTDRKWPVKYCVCGNILGVIHRKKGITFLNQFRNVVSSNQLGVIINVNRAIDYAVEDLMYGKVICPKCGHAVLWNANENYFKNKIRELGLEEQYLKAINKT